MFIKLLRFFGIWIKKERSPKETIDFNIDKWDWNPKDNKNILKQINLFIEYWNTNYKIHKLDNELYKIKNR